MKKGIVFRLLLFVGAVAGIIRNRKIVEKKIKKEIGFANKHLKLFLMMNQWVQVKQRGKNLANYFQENGYKKIAVYGMSYAGETFVNELQGTDVQVLYGIDQRADYIYTDIDIYTINDALDPVDAVVVTAITFFNEIEDKLCEKMNCPILSLEEILNNI